MLSYNSYRPGGPWEYQMFTEVLTATRYSEKKKYSLIHADTSSTHGTCFEITIAL